VAQRLEVRIEIFQEGELYVGLCPDLDVSSFGEIPEDAKQSVQEALEAFFRGMRGNGNSRRSLTRSRLYTKR
jgi:predicted RNase H-like HicB family nuclease